MPKANFLNKKNWMYYVSAILIYILIYIPALHVPFHSDDYHYFLQGISLENRWDHYMNWSGRLITDFTSSYLLNLFSKPVYTAINSLVFLLFIVNISILPNVVTKKTIINEKSHYILWLIFITYWVSNPNLGQTSFWIVGSANYIWPLMWASLYFIYLFHSIYKTENNFKSFAVLSILGFLAGASNEATGVSVVFFSIIMFFIYRKNKAILLTGLITNVIGFLLLYLSPGNQARLEHRAFENWRELSFFDHTFTHIYDRLPSAFSNYWFVLSMIILVVLIISSIMTQEKTKQKSHLYAVVFFILSVFSVFVFIKSPAMPPRSLNTGLFYLLITLSFLINYSIHLPSRNYLYPLVPSLIIGSIYFIPSYVFFTKAIINTKTQGDIREELIIQAKTENKNEVKIPDWYFTELLKNSDKFDLYRSGRMAKYYGIEKIIWTPARFNYAILKTALPFKSEQLLKDGLTLKSIFYYTESNKDYLVFNFNESLLKHIEPGDNILYIHLYESNKNSFINADIDIKHFTEIGEEYFYAIQPKEFEISKLEKINFGFYNRGEKKNSASFTLNFKDLYNNQNTK